MYKQRKEHLSERTPVDIPRRAIKKTKRQKEKETKKKA